MDNEQVTSEELTNLLVALRAIEQEVETLKAEIKPLEDKQHAIQDAIKTDRLDTEKAVTELYTMISAMKNELAERLKVLDEENRAIHNEAYDKRIAIRRKEAERQSLERQIEQAKRAALAAAEWSTLEARWDKMTMGAPWREWAKDHQIEGGKKMTYEGRMILADTMGLGKTLTSLIFIDMVEAATKNASEDNPVEFGSMK